MITEIQGDILSPATEPTLICHQTNCRGVMGAGLALQIRKMFPSCYELYREYCADMESSALGTVLLSSQEGTNITIANIFGQGNYGRNACYTDYAALRKAFRTFSILCTFNTIRIPYKMGCGLGGGNWGVVLKTIEQELGDCNVEIWRLPE